MAAAKKAFCKIFTKTKLYN